MCVATLCHALLARHPFEWSLLNAVAVAGLALWVASAATTSLRWLRTRTAQPRMVPAEVTRLAGEGLADEIEHRRTSGQRLH
jgi:hypothetical protein